MHGVGVEPGHEILAEQLVGLTEHVEVVVADGRRERELIGSYVDEALDRARYLVGVAHTAGGGVGSGPQLFLGRLGRQVGPDRHAGWARKRVEVLEDQTRV